MSEENIDYLDQNIFSELVNQKKYEIKTGLINFKGKLSNVCFMNSIYQVLFNVPELICYVLSEQYEKDKKVNGGVADAFKNLVLNIVNNSGENVLLNDLENLKAAIAKSYKWFEGSQQNDTSEFFSCLSSCLSEELNTPLTFDEEYETLIQEFEHDSDVVAKHKRKAKNLTNKRNSFLTRLFYFWQISQHFCAECGSCLNYRFNNTNILDLISDIHCHFETLYDGIKLTTHWEKNGICKKCNKEVQVCQKDRFVNAPNYLLIKKNRNKNENIHEIEIEHPLEFPANDFSLGDLVINKEDQDVKYDLVSVVCHTGNGHGGHYFTYSKKSDGWYYFSDSYMKKMPDDFKINEDKSIKNNFCILLYAIKDNERYKRLFKSFGIKNKKEKADKPVDNVDISVGKEKNKNDQDEKKDEIKKYLKKEKDAPTEPKVINNTEPDKNLEDRPIPDIQKPVNKQHISHEENIKKPLKQKDEKELEKEDAPIINNTEHDKNPEDKPKPNIQKPANKQDIGHEENIKDLDYDLDYLLKTYDDLDKLQDIFLKAKNQKDLFIQARKNLNSAFSEGRNRMKKLGDTEEKIDLALNKLKKEMIIYVLYLETGSEVKKYIVDEIKKADNIGLLSRIWQTIKSFIMLRFLEIGKAKQSRKLDILKHAFDKIKTYKHQERSK